MMSTNQIRRILANSSSVLLDFDGPICSIFAGMTDVAVADRLREVLAGVGVAVDEEVRRTRDPLAVLQFAGTRASRDVLAAVESVLISAEVEAVASAQPTPFAKEFVQAAVATGRSIAVVSNNSADAIEHYLDRLQLRPSIAAVVGRSRERPDLMKPNPFPLNEALRRISDVAEKAVLVGDSEADLEASRLAGVACIGYADNRQRMERLEGADARIRSMSELLGYM